MSICEVEDCNGKIVAHGLCDKHRKRLKRHGHLKQTRPSDWGMKEKHPLYNTWCWMRKMRAKFSICGEWEDFWKFVDDVGDRPSPSHRFSRKDKYGNFSIDNFEWKETKPDTNASEYAKQWRKDNPEKVKNTELRKMFGITLEDYNKMYEDQNGSCKICNTHSTNEKQALVVDHNHTTGKVRGLLCNQCNRGIGMLKDSKDILQNAIDYLKK